MTGGMAACAARFRVWAPGESAIGYQAAFIDEEAVRPAPGAAESVDWFGTDKGGVRRLRNSRIACQTSCDLVYLGEQFPQLATNQHVAYYVGVYVEPPAPGPVRPGVDSDHGFVLWVNGRGVGGKNVTGSLGIGTDRFVVNLERGRNLVLLKIIQGGHRAGRDPLRGNAVSGTNAGMDMSESRGEPEVLRHGRFVG